MINPSMQPKKVDKFLWEIEETRMNLYLKEEVKED
jgi:hypothetical protein